MKAKDQARREAVNTIKRAAEKISEAAYDLHLLGTSSSTIKANAEAVLAWVYDREREDVLYQQKVLREDPPCIACGAPESVCDC